MTLHNNFQSRENHLPMKKQIINNSADQNNNHPKIDSCWKLCEKPQVQNFEVMFARTGATFALPWQSSQTCAKFLFVQPSILKSSTTIVLCKCPWEGKIQCFCSYKKRKKHVQTRMKLENKDQTWIRRTYERDDEKKKEKVGVDQNVVDFLVFETIP